MFIKPRGKQLEIIDLDFNGHAVVLGSAGSGKSTCALIRAEAIANVKNEKVLVLTYNNSLVNYMNNLIEDSDNITITTYHKFAVAYLRDNGLLKPNAIISTSVLKEKYIKAAIIQAVSAHGYNLIYTREDFIIEEISWMQKVGCATLEEYETITRHGRGKGSLNRADRKYVFYVYEKYLNLRKLNGYQYDWDDIAYYANKHIESCKSSPKYSHIIIDEGQDFSPTMIKFLVNYIGNAGSVMYLGDAAQQIFGTNGTWISSGLSIRKAYKLDKNYRNTKEIEALGNEIRKNIPLSEQEVLISQNSETSGNLPKVVKVNSPTEELNYILDEASKLRSEGSVAIICTTKSRCKEIHHAFSYKNIESLEVDRYEKNFKGQNDIFVGTYHSLKGLEFDNVILYNCTDKEFNCHNIDNLDNERKEELLTKVSKLLYVGVTRAKHNLIITYVDNLMRAFPSNSNLYTLDIKAS